MLTLFDNTMGFPGGLVDKESAYSADTQVQSLNGKDPWRRKWQPTPVFLPPKSHGQRTLMVHSHRVAQSQT